MAQVAVPGQLLGSIDKYIPGPGIHVRDANLYASLLGTVAVAQPDKAPGPSKRLNRIISSQTGPLPTISVSRPGAVHEKQREVLPEVGNIVLCRVTRIQPRQATVAILVVGDSVLEADWQGIIRVQDVRATEKDRVKIYESFRPGDIVRAQVVSNHSRGTFAERELAVGISGFTDMGNRSLWVTRPTIILPQRVTSLALSWRQAKQGTQCFL